ncbi:MAG TPA: CoA pyrophosphatase [Flavobacterium sp.]|jgi:8-oxo-dGTP pyrophosphatase MutT (NUDIX family)
MDFAQFLQCLPNLRNVTLPGEASHCKMSPPERREIIRNLDLSKVNPRKAAILMLVYPNAEGKACLALIVRNTYKGVHSSQIAFPGGKVETFDLSNLEAALRETEEEIGIPRTEVVFVSAFTEVYIPPSNFFVAPFLGYVSETPSFIPDPREVAAMMEMPIENLLNDNNVVLKEMSTSYSESIQVPVFAIGDQTIWGATAMMLSELKDVLKAML